MELNNLNIIDYAIVAVYFISMILIGFLVIRLNKKEQDYFKGGNRIPWVMSAMSLFIGSFTAYMFVGASGQAHKVGLSCLLLYTSSFYGCVIVYFFVADKWRRTRITSPTEYLEMRFGKSFRYFFSFIQIPFSILGGGNLLFVLSIFISSALKFTGEFHILGFSLNGLELCILVTGISTVLYTTAGGIWAVILTDTVQFIIVMVMSILLIPYCFIALGQGHLVQGVRQFLTQPPTPDYFRLIKPSQTFFFTFAWMCLMLLSFPGGLGVAQRLYTVPRETDARKTIALSAIFYLIIPLIWVLPVFIMRPFLTNLETLWPQLKNPNEASYVTITLMLLPNGMIGLTVSAILAATMSTVSVNYNIFSSIFVEDIYKPFLAKRPDSKNTLYASRICTFIYGILTIIMGMFLVRYGKGDAFKTTFTISAHLSLVFALPFAIGLLFRRIPWWTPFISIPVCLATTLSLEYLLGGKLGALYPGTIFARIKENAFPYTVFGSMAINFLIYFIASFFYNEKDPTNRKADHLFQLLKKPVSEDPEAVLFIPNLKTYRVVGKTLALFGISMILLFLSGLADDPRKINLLAGLIFMALFAVIQWFTSPSLSPFALVRKQMRDDITTNDRRFRY